MSNDLRFSTYLCICFIVGVATYGITFLDEVGRSVVIRVCMSSYIALLLSLLLVACKIYQLNKNSCGWDHQTIISKSSANIHLFVSVITLSFGFIIGTIINSSQIDDLSLNMQSSIITLILGVSIISIVISFIKICQLEKIKEDSSNKLKK